MVRRRAGRDHYWSNIREWMNVVAAIGGLVVAVVALWATAQISGLENYLRSEIGRRNNELNSLSRKAESLEKTADERARRLSELQATTEALMASSVAAQQNGLFRRTEISRP